MLHGGRWEYTLKCQEAWILWDIRVHPGGACSMHKLRLALWLFFPPFSSVSDF